MPALVFVWNAGAAVDSADYKPTGDVYSMQMHFNWCGEGKAPADRLKRYEKFWELQAPKEPQKGKFYAIVTAGSAQEDQMYEKQYDAITASIERLD